MWLGVLLGVYAAIGLWFGIVGIQRVDPLVKGSSVGFRLIILPGVVALWPLLLRRGHS